MTRLLCRVPSLLIACLGLVVSPAHAVIRLGVVLSLTAPGAAIVERMDERRRWAFRLGPSEKFSSDLVADDVKRRKGGTIGVIALASAYGDGFLRSMEASAASRSLKIVGVERYNVTDQSVTA